MILTQAPPSRRKPRQHSQFGVYDPSHLGTKLRELALRAHRLIRAAEEARPLRHVGANFALACDSEFELIDTHAHIVQLERNLRAEHRLDSLAAYVAALRQKVEEYLD